jgi:hypothetical protein
LQTFDRFRARKLIESDTQNAIVKVDNTSTVSYPNKRRSVRIQSQDAVRRLSIFTFAIPADLTALRQYPIGSLWVFDFLHVPYGCSVWPAAWSQATVWPTGGEIDTFEGVNLMQSNQVRLNACI